MFRSLVVLATFVLTLGPAGAKEIDAAKLRQHLSMSVRMGTEADLTDIDVLLPGERIISNPRAEIARLRSQLTGEPADAPLHLRMGELYDMLRRGCLDDRYSVLASEQYEQAAEQYKSLLSEKPSDPALLLGYAKALGRTEREGKERAKGILEKLVAADPSAWEARFELADRLVDQATAGAGSGMFLEQAEATTLPGMDEMPKPLSGEEVGRLLGEAARQRDMAIKHAPEAPDPYLRYCGARLRAAVPRWMLLEAVSGESEEADDGAVSLKLGAEVFDPTPLQKAWKYDPEDATVLRHLVLCECAEILIKGSSGRLAEKVLAEDPAKRAWNVISEEDRTRLSGYEESIRNAIDKRPEDVWAAHEALGILKTFQGRRQDAEKAFMSAAKLSAAANLSYILLFLFQFQVGLSDEIEGVALFKRLVPLWEMRVRLYGCPSDMLNVASLYVLVDRLDGAESLVRRVLREDAENRGAHHLLGVVLLKRQSDPREAIRHLEKALTPPEAEPTTVITWQDEKPDCEPDRMRLNLGIAYAIAGDVERAREQLNKIPDESKFHKKAQEVLKELDD